MGSAQESKIPVNLNPSRRINFPLSDVASMRTLLFFFPDEENPWLMLAKEEDVKAMVEAHQRTRSFHFIFREKSQNSKNYRTKFDDNYSPSPDLMFYLLFYFFYFIIFNILSKIERKDFLTIYGVCLRIIIFKQI